MRDPATGRSTRQLALQVIVGMFDITEREARGLLRSSAAESTAWSPVLQARPLIEDWVVEPAAVDVLLAALEDDDHGSAEFEALLAKLASRGLLLPGAQIAIRDGLHELLGT